MRINTYLSFDGNCRHAFERYQALLGGKIAAMQSFGETPGCDQFPPEVKDRIMHARLDLTGISLMGTDATPEHPYEGVKGAHVVIDVEDPKRAEQLFEALSEGGRIDMPLQQTFWARKYGILVDRFGVPWMINCT